MIDTHSDYDSSSDPLAFWLPLARDRFLHEQHTDTAVLDRDLDALASVLRLGLTRRNGMALVARLPPEIMGVIFEFIRQEVYGEYEDIGDKEREGKSTEVESKVKIMSWATFSHVCRSWRQISFDCPSIWREIKFSHTGPKWAYEMLQRSKASPLHVEIGAGAHANPYFRSEDVYQFTRQLLQEHSHRLRAFTLFGEEIGPLATQLISHPNFPILKFLHLENTASLTGLGIYFSALAKCASHLRELCVIGAHFIGSVQQNAPAVQLVHLTYFDLQLPDSYQSEQLQTWYILDVLECMPALQHLYITDVFPVSLPPAFCSPAKLAAPLETLTLAARRFPQELITFSAMLAHPTVFRDFEFNDVAPEILTALLVRHVGEARPPRSLYLELDHAANKLVFSASYTPWAPSPAGDTPTPLNDISVSVQNIAKHAMPFCSAVCMREVVDLTFMDDEPADANRRWEAFKPARAVRHLRVIGTASSALFDILATPPGDPDGRGDMFPVAEALSVIEMTELAPQLGEDRLNEADKLLDALRARHDRGVPIRDLKVPDRLAKGEWLDPMRQFTAKIGGSRPRFY